MIGLSDVITIEVDYGLSKKKTSAYQVNEYFAVAKVGNGWRAYLLHTGKQLLNLAFVDVIDAVRFVNFYTAQYSEYFDIWRDYPHAEIHAWLKWTVRHGLDSHVYIEDLKTQKNIEKLNELPI